MSPETRLELQQLLSALCDGELTASRHHRLEELLAGDADCRREYLEYMDLHARLLGHPGMSENADATPSRRARGWWRVSPWLRYAAVAAATVAASLLVQVFWRHADKSSTGSPAGPKPAAAHVATLTLTTDCEWENPAEKRRAGARLPPGELRLKKGVVQVRFDVGPQLVVEGPAILRLESNTTATLERGKVVFRTDESAARFDLSTPTGTLTDLGTEYAVAVTAEGEEVQVFDGEVERMPRAAPKAEPERLKAGQARRYGRSPDAAGEEAEYDPTRFVRQLAPGPDPAGGLLAYEGFEYQDADVLYTGQATGGFGWTSPWTSAFGPPPGHHNWGGFKVRALDVEESLDRPGALVPSRGGRFDCTGFVLFYRRLATPVRLDADGVYYLSFLFRRSGPTAHPMNSVSVMLRPDEDPQTRPDLSARLTIGAGGSNQVFTHLGRACARASLPLSTGTNYLLVAKIVTSSSAPAQVFVRVYAPREPIGDDEPGSWTLIGAPFHSSLVLEWLGIHVNSKNRQMIDEIRLGTTWQSVTAPYRGPPTDVRP